MPRRSTLLVLAVVAGLLTVVPSLPAQAQDRDAAALARLRADAHGGVTITRDHDGRARFVGTPAHAAVDNPSVSARTAPAAAARAQLDRYGAVFGADPGSTYRSSPVRHAGGGTEVVRFAQHLDGVPVLGGEIVVTDGTDGELRSLAGGVAGPTSIKAPTVDPDRAAATARALVAREHRHTSLSVEDQGRWVLDPALAGLDLPGGARTVRRLEVRGGAGVRELVLVDDHTGRPVFRTSLIEGLNRVVCDDANLRSAETLCSTGFARAEGDAPSGVTDVNKAYDYAGEVSAFYGAISGGHLDVTQALDIHVDAVPKLAATVRFCTNTKSNGVSYDDPCPFPNAFWDGRQMYYGAGYAAADDVVGHEMTHGIIDTFSRLFYWGQSGAINESLADTMGEFIDHRNGGDDDSAWDLGEDLPGGALRNMADPTVDQQPDRTTSTLYTADASYNDAGGVHTNSGVGNKTAFLISQGGTFNGQDITGIDLGDPTLNKSSMLYLLTIETLPSGSDWAQLADTLVQSCATLQSVGLLTAANCASVAQATTATELSVTPTNAAQPTDADVSCPVGTTKRVLLDSEAGTTAQQQARFSTSTTAGMRAFSRTPDWGSNATSGLTSWFVDDQRTAGQSLLYATDPTSLPAGQPSYLTFQGWNLLDYDSGGYYDGGIVEVNVDNQTNHYDATSGWVNGPTHTLFSGTGNSRAGYRAFAGDSHGWVRSSYDLSQWAGHQVTPRFSLFTDDDGSSDFSLIGWYLDDIQIYTCDVPPPAAGPVQNLTNTGVPRSSATGPVRQRITWQAPSLNPGSVTGYQISVDGVVTQTVAPAVRTVDLTLSTVKPHTIAVRAVSAGNVLSDPVSTLTVPSTLTLTLSRVGTTVTFHGSLKRNGVGFAKQKVWMERKSGTTWVAAGSTTTTSSGAYLLKVTRSTAAAYRVRFAGAAGVTGSFSPIRTK